MVFYEDFLKKIKNAPEKKYRDVEKFSLEMKRMIMFMGTGIPILLVAIYQLYIGIYGGVKIINLAFGLIFIYVAYKQFKIVLNYKLIIDQKNRKIFYDKIEIDMDKITSCTLKEITMGKRAEIQPAVDIVTEGGEQYIIPLMMSRKLDFVLAIKQSMGAKFQIAK